MARADITRRSTRQAATRKRSLYAEPDTDDDDFEVSAEEEPEHNPRPVKRVKRSAGRPPRRQPQTRSRRDGRSAKATKPVRRKVIIGAPLKPRKEHVEPKVEILSDGNIPAWQTLPLDIWVQIFAHAAEPLEESGNITWLMQTARRVCRVLAQPALEAYYRSPALVTSMHPHHLLDLMTMPKEKRYMDYNVKVRSLEIDVRRLAYQAHNKRAFDIGALVRELPQLHELSITHPLYEPPYRQIGTPIQKWTYPESLFEALDGHRIKSWRWNENMCSNSVSKKRQGFHSYFAFEISIG